MPIGFLADAPPQLPPARELMAFTLGAHILLVPFGVALPAITLLMHYRGLRKNDAVALQLARRWSAVMAVQFAIGIVTGTVLSFEFGLLWPGMMGRWGDVFGLGFGVDAWAFFLEAILIAIYLYGWRRLKPWAHFWLGLPLPLAALMGAFRHPRREFLDEHPAGFTLDANGIVLVVYVLVFGTFLTDVIAGVLLTAVAGYACGGGTDYGAGFWDLVAGASERGRRPRWLIDHAMEPVWETNNVWLIFVLVIRWTGFPVLFQTVFSAMWLPLALAAVGLVLRGAGFALRKPTRRLARRRVHGAAFAVSSLQTRSFSEPPSGAWPPAGWLREQRPPPTRGPTGRP